MLSILTTNRSPRLPHVRSFFSVAATALLCVSFLGLTGCVSQQQADELTRLNRKLNEQIVELEARLEEAQGRVSAMQELQSAGQSDLEAKLASAIASREALKKALADAEDKLRNASKVGPLLPAPLDDALAKLAASNPGLMTYDPQRGAVVFTSDLTFALGAVNVSSQALTSLSKLATILASPIAANYEAQIVGHTDNVPITRPATKAKHPTNWHLSVHRAIAVKDVLRDAGVPPQRMMVAGYGSFHPLAPNPAKGGNQANRRVEIFLVASTATPFADDVEPADAPQVAPTPAPDATPPASVFDLGPSQFK